MNIAKGKSPIQEAIHACGYEPYTPVQQQVIPLLEQGKSCFVQAPTGAGKTASYLIPMLEAYEKDPSFFTIVVAPTRELALQVGKEAKLLSSYMTYPIAVCVGGLDPQKQINQLKRSPACVIGTPGRLLDFCRQGILDVSSVNLLVLDEADQLLILGQKEEALEILSRVHAKQTALFSATGEKDCEMFLPKDFVTVKLQETEKVHDTITTYRYDTKQKLFDLEKLLNHLPITSAFVFVNHTSTCADLVEALISKGILAASFSSRLDQKKRLSTMEKFSKGEIRVLVASDAAARGLDIQDVSHVIHYDFPIDEETYIHRSGRAGHQGQAGASILFYDSSKPLSPFEETILSTTNPLPPLTGKGTDLTKPLVKEAKKQPQDVQTFLVRAGKKDKIRAKDLLGAFCSVVNGSSIGTIEIQDRYCIVPVRSTDPDLFDKIHRLSIKGKVRTIERKK